MNKEQIKDFLDIVILSDEKKLFEYFQITEGKAKENEDIIFKELMSNIEKGDYEYFKSLQENPLYKETITYLMRYSSRTEDMKELIERKEELKLRSHEIVPLIIGINDSEYTDICIEKREKLGLSSNDIVSLIIAMDDPEYIDKYINKFITDTKRYGYTFSEEYKENALGLKHSHVKSLLSAIKDPEYIDKYIGNRRTREELSLMAPDIVELVSRLKNPEYTDKCIENRKKLDLSVYDLISIIKNINNPEYTDKYIENRKKFKFDEFNIKELIQGINTPEYTEKWIKRKEEIGLSNLYIVELIQGIGDPIYIVQSIEKRNELGLDKNIVFRLCNDLDEEVFLKYFLNISEQLDNEDYYEEFVKNYLGEIQFDEKTKKPIISEEIEKIIFNPKDEEIAKKIKANLPQIISMWEPIKEQIQYKRANSIKNNGLEIKVNAEEIVLAINVLNRRRPQKISEVDFENTPGSEKVGIDTQYTEKPENAVERAYDLSRKMDEAKCEKKYPDFSVEDEEISLKVLHPQDKSAILLGYETNCCFRPNGNADASAKTQYSLLQYCTTTPYGGVMRVESKDVKNVYMGSPILRSGNCLMLHSYESNNNEKTEQVNKLLDKAAVKAIEESNGSIKAVFITDLHTGKEKLDIEKRLVINTFFKEYTEDEYSDYKNMYTNLDSKNVVLAINVDGKILTGEQIGEWFKKECNGDQEIFKEKLGLHLGKVEENYEYPRRSIYQEIAIDNEKLVNKFYSRYQELKEERNILALINKKKQLESKEELTKEEKESLDIIDEELEQYKEYEEYLKLTKQEIKRRLNKNREESFEMFSGEDIYIIAELYGITQDDIEKIITEKVTMQYEKNEPSIGESSKSKKLKGKIISQIKECNNSELIRLISKVAKEQITEKELELLEKSGIETKEYESICIKKEECVDLEKIKSDKINGQVKKILEDKSAVEAVVANQIFKEVTEEELKLQILEDFIKTIKSYVYDYYVSQDLDGMITDDEKEKINEQIHELDIDNMISKCIEIDFEPTKWSEDMDEKFGLDVKNEYNKILRNQAKLRSKIQKKKLEKLKSDVTIGIRKKEKIAQLSDSIAQGNKESDDKEFERMIFGNNWYIGFSSGNSIFYIDPNISEDDKKDLKLALRKEIDKQRGKKLVEENKTICMIEMKEVVSEVSLDDKEVAVKIMEEMLKDLEKGEN